MVKRTHVARTSSLRPVPHHQYFDLRAHTRKQGAHGVSVTPGVRTLAMHRLKRDSTPTSRCVHGTVYAHLVCACMCVGLHTWMLDYILLHQSSKERWRAIVQARAVSLSCTCQVLTATYCKVDAYHAQHLHTAM